MHRHGAQLVGSRQRSSSAAPCPAALDITPTPFGLAIPHKCEPPVFVGPYPQWHIQKLLNARNRLVSINTTLVTIMNRYYSTYNSTFLPYPLAKAAVSFACFSLCADCPSVKLQRLAVVFVLTIPRLDRISRGRRWYPRPAQLVHATHRQQMDSQTRHHPPGR